MAIEGYSMATLGDFVGQELGVSEWEVVDQARIDAFAQCTGDHQWIHVDVERATNEGPFGCTIAHGYLTLSMVGGHLTGLGIVPDDAGAAFNYGVENTRFLAPVKCGSRVRTRARLVEAQTRGDGKVLVRTNNTVEIEGDARPALVTDALVLLVA